MEETFFKLSGKVTLPNGCQSVSLREMSNRGRGLVASRDFKPNEDIFCEEALTFGPKQCNLTLCPSCLEEIRAFSFKCVCGLWKCGEFCRGRSHCKEECDLIARAKLSENELRNSSRWIFVLKACSLKNDELEAFELLQGHQDNRGDSSVVSKVTGFDDEKVKEVIAKIDSNSFRLSENLRSTFGLASMINHNCDPNARIVFIDDNPPRIKVKSKRTIRKGEEISISYCPPMLNTRERREKLLKSKFFRCDCSRCQDFSEKRTHLGSLLCPKCRNVVVPKGENYICIQCPFKTGAEKVEKLLKAIEKEQRLCSKKSEEMEKVLQRHSTRLPQSHSLMLEFKNELLSVYSKERANLSRRFELIRERIGILNQLEANSISRLRGFLTYKLHLLLVEEARNDVIRSGRISPILAGEIRSTLEEASAILAEDVACPKELKEVNKQMTK